MQLGVEFVDLTAVSIPVELVSYVPKNIAKKFCVVSSVRTSGFQYNVRRKSSIGGIRE